MTDRLSHTLRHSAGILHRAVTVPFHVLRRGFTRGWCPICEKATIFYREGEWLRDQLRCIRCASIPRWRALIHVLTTHFPDWRTLLIHESSPAGAASAKLARECSAYTASAFLSGVAPGQIQGGRRCENLERLSFPDAAFDLVITQDVFEHILDPARAFREVARTLVPTGAHVFTVPWYSWQATIVRAIRTPNGVQHIKAPYYHGDPFNPHGALVVTEWGKDLCDFIRQCSGMTTTIITSRNPLFGIEGEFLEVFISRKGPSVSGHAIAFEETTDDRSQENIDKRTES